MTAVQELLVRLLPPQLAVRMRRASESWMIRCCTCGARKSVWEVGGVRWGAASVGKRMLAACSRCRRLRCAAVVWDPSAVVD